MAQPRAISGNQGDVLVGGSNIAELTEWNATLDYGVKTYVAQSGVSGGIGYQKTVRGNTKCSGTISGLLDPNYPIDSALAAGALVTLKLISQSGVPASYIYCSLARIGTRTAGANINTGDPQPFTATFESDGVVTVTNM